MLVLVLVLVLLLAGFLFTPLVAYVDTEENRYEIFQRPVFNLRVNRQGGSITPQLRLIGINIPLKARKESRPVERKPTKRRLVHRSFSAWRFLIERSLKSFKIKSVVVDVDTDDVVLNAQLIPLFMMVSNGPVRFSANFQQRIYFHLDIRNQPVRILWIAIQLLLKK